MWEVKSSHWHFCKKIRVFTIIASSTNSDRSSKKRPVKGWFFALFGAVALFLFSSGLKPTKFTTFTLGGKFAWKDKIEEVFASNTQNKNLLSNNQASVFLGSDSLDVGLEDHNDQQLALFNAFLGEQAPFVTPGSLADRLGVKSYRVAGGDTVADVAKTFNLKTETILGANDLRYGDYILPGEVLLILPSDGILHKVQPGQTLASIASYYEVAVEDISKANLVSADGSDLEANQEIFIPGGKQFIGTAPPSQSSALANYDDYYAFPTTGRNWGRIHSNNGIDISNVCGTEIFASAAGTVGTVADTESTYRFANGGYGTNVRITHPNGTVTLYAHLLSVLVSDGDRVSKGQLIAWMGGRPGTPGAGNSTGCHLHFEVRGAQNPFARYR